MLLATILSYAVARTMTRPLAAVTGAMRHVAATGDLTRKVALRSRAWDDEDARVLAASFNTLTESISRFQREATQKDRLSSLGRLSTVVAHEIRNPLMIISATLATLRRRDPSKAELREAIADIDGETRRLNRLVTEVLDFAKPIRFEWSIADVNEVCRSSVAAAWTGASPDAVQLDFDSTIPGVTTDPERLRTALVNILANARHAVEAVAAAPRAGWVARRGSGIACRHGAHSAYGWSDRCHHPGSGHRHRCRRHDAHLRSVFHDPPGRHRPGAADLAQHHRRARRQHPRPQHSRLRNGDLPSTCR